MSDYKQDSFMASLPLGKAIRYTDQYDATLLQALPRRLARKNLQFADGLQCGADTPLGKVLPFHGADIWTLYELSWLNSRGLPQVATGMVTVSADSECLVESKSFKLYLNSFNQTVFADWQTVRETLQRDLAACVHGEVRVSITPLQQQAGQPLMDFTGECIDDQLVTISDYQLNSDLLVNAIGETVVNESLVSHLLKSNCLITQQPDWGSLQISYCGKCIDRERLLRYVVSLRQHNEFHEHCVERIFCDVWRLCRPQMLSVYARYTRRGGLDINPWRSNDPYFVPATGRLVRQ